MTVKDIADFLLTLPEEVQNREPMCELSINLPNGEKWQAQAGIAGFEKQLENAIMSPMGVHPLSAIEDVYNVYRAEVAAGISDESAEMEGYNPLKCPVIIKEGVLVFVLSEGTMTEEVVHRIASSSKLNSLDTPLSDDLVRNYVELRYSQLAHSLLKAWSQKALPYDIEFVQQFISDVENRRDKILNPNQPMVFAMLDRAKAALMGNEYSNGFPDAEQFPRCFIGKYHFILGLLMEAIKYQDVPSDCAFLSAVKALLTGTKSELNQDEEQLLEILNGNTLGASNLTINRD